VHAHKIVRNKYFMCQHAAFGASKDRKRNINWSTKEAGHMAAKLGTRAEMQSGEA